MTHLVISNIILTIRYDKDFDCDLKAHSLESLRKSKGHEWTLDQPFWTTVSVKSQRPLKWSWNLFIGWLGPSHIQQLLKKMDSDFHNCMVNWPDYMMFDSPIDDMWVGTLVHDQGPRPSIWWVPIGTRLINWWDILFRVTWTWIGVSL